MSSSARARSDAVDRGGLGPGARRADGHVPEQLGQGFASEAACKPSSVPRLAPRRRSSIWGRRLPDGSCSRPEGWAARLSPRRTGVAPSYLALLRVEFAAFHSGPEGPASSLWHWSSPHGGRALPATLRWGARTFLTPPGCPADARPSGRLAGLRSVGVIARTGHLGGHLAAAQWPSGDPTVRHSGRRCRRPTDLSAPEPCRRAFASPSDAFTSVTGPFGRPPNG